MVQTVIQNINMLNKILQWCRQSYRTSKKYYNVIQNINMLNKILQWCRRSYRTSTCSTKYYNGVDGHTEHQHAQQNNTMWQRVIQNINMLNKILEWCRQSYRTSTCHQNIKYYNVVESHTEHQHAQQNTTMVQTVIQNINMLNKILQWCRRSYRTSTCSTK